MNCQLTSLLYGNTWLDLDEVKDPLGDPVRRTTSGPKRIRAYVAAKAEEWLRAAAATEVMRIQLPAEGPNQSWHTADVTGVGENPGNKVENKWGLPEG